MYPEHINLLPGNRIRSFVVRYYVRLVALAACMFSLLLIAHGLLLLPTHLYLDSQVTEHQLELTTLAASPDASDETGYSARIAALAKSANEIKTLGKQTPSIFALTNILNVPHPQVSLAGLSYTAATAKKGATLIISGTAAGRDDLRKYQLALQNASFVASADLPVSTYAKDSDIIFAITVLLTSP